MELANALALTGFLALCVAGILATGAGYIFTARYMTRAIRILGAGLVVLTILSGVTAFWCFFQAIWAQVPA